MGFINKTTLSIAGKQAETSLKSILLPQGESIESALLTFAPQQAANTVVKGKQNKTTPFLLQNISDIAEMRASGMSLRSIAETFGISRGKCNYFMKNHLAGVDTENRMFNKAIKDFCSADSEEAKAQAFSIVDGYLAKIAREQVKKQKNLSYEDCLQDLRLKFFEITESKKKNGTIIPREINKAVAKTKPVKEVKTVSLSSVKTSQTQIHDGDDLIKLFESEDAFNGILAYCNSLSSREKEAIISLKKGNSIEEIQKQFGIESYWYMKSIIVNAIKKIRATYEKVTSEEFLQDRLKSAQKLCN